MANPGMNDYTKTQINRKSPKNAKRWQPIESQQNTKTDIQAKWGACFLHLVG